jgi:epoxyqueuosine reductase
MLESEKGKFSVQPADFLAQAIKAYVRDDPGNRLPLFPEERIWDEPLVGFASGDDPLFTEYKTLIGEFHLTPREALRQAYPDAAPEHVSVIVWVLPSTRATRLSMRRETRVPSLRWNQSRWPGQDFNYALSRYVVALLTGQGRHAVAPELLPAYKLHKLPEGLAANWSERHAAYAAGLGTFSLSDGFITPKGIAVRLGSVVADIALPPSPRPYSDFRANCLFYRNGSCRRCMSRCPAGAITEKGHDRNKCCDFLFNEQRAILTQLGREQGYLGKYLGCGLCQCKVPCEGGIPPDPPSVIAGVAKQVA